MPVAWQPEGSDVRIETYGYRTLQLQILSLGIEIIYKTRQAYQSLILNVPYETYEGRMGGMCGEWRRLLLAVQFERNWMLKKQIGKNLSASNQKAKSPVFFPNFSFSNARCQHLVAAGRGASTCWLAVICYVTCQCDVTIEIWRKCKQRKSCDHKTTRLILKHCFSFTVDCSKNKTHPSLRREEEQVKEYMRCALFL